MLPKRAAQVHRHAIQAQCASTALAGTDPCASSKSTKQPTLQFLTDCCTSPFNWRLLISSTAFLSAIPLQFLLPSIWTAYPLLPKLC